ncbi:hypothetical protein HS088_TW19G00037 [Tripterygium wilfordii]|uniref:BZIP domain-containing protein n=1 Tax=Tripterygium wilfordii TaxID=458696 RepID=A0A7J7C8I0_TRIWF|nr:hypothetical protein HS088_TW19G00037 [Tripterygium wilfordii]
MTALSLSIGTQEPHHHHNIPDTNQHANFAFNLNIGNSLSPRPYRNANAVANEVNADAGENAIINHQLAQAVNVNACAGENVAINDQFGQGLSTGNGQRKSGYGRRAGGRLRKNPDSEKHRLRMIKNRESAARSRARKQAQEAQRQIEISNLKKENELLKGVTRFLLAAVRIRNLRTPMPSRSFSAPFLG